MEVKPAVIGEPGPSRSVAPVPRVHIVNDEEYTPASEVRRQAAMIFHTRSRGP
jgi:hypothetical protein